VAPDAPSGKEVARLEDGRFIELERQLLAMRAAQTEWDRRIAQLTDGLALKSALLEEAEANAAEAKMELRELQAKLDELLLSRDHALEYAEANAAEEKKRAALEVRELQAKLDELMQSRDEQLRTPEKAQSALQKATSRAADVNADERSQPASKHETELAEMRAELEGKKSELESVRLRLSDAEDGWAKSKAEADTLRTQTTADLVNTDVDRVMHRLLERMRAMEVEMSSLRGNEKSIESMECRNEG